MALCAVIAAAEAQQTGAAGPASPGAKSIPWDEPGKPPGVAPINGYSAKKSSRQGAARAERQQGGCDRRSDSYLMISCQQQEPSAKTRAGRLYTPNTPREVTPEAQAEVKQRNTIEADRAEARRLEALKEAQAKADMEARARAEAEGEARAKIIAQMRAKALAEEQRRLEAEKSRDRFAPRSEPQPAFPPAPAAPQAGASGQMASPSSSSVRVTPESTGSIVAPRVGENGAGGASAAVQTPPPAVKDSSEPSWAPSVCRRLFFGLLGC
jgi:hypothetical protein